MSASAVEDAEYAAGPRHGATRMVPDSVLVLKHCRFRLESVRLDCCDNTLNKQNRYQAENTTTSRTLGRSLGGFLSLPKIINNGYLVPSEPAVKQAVILCLAFVSLRRVFGDDFFAAGRCHSAFVWHVKPHAQLVLRQTPAL